MAHHGIAFLFDISPLLCQIFSLLYRHMNNIQNQLTQIHFQIA